MKWNKFRLKTTTEAEDIVSSMLADLGIEGVEIEDKIPLTESDKEQMFVDILPEIEADDGVAYLSFIRKRMRTKKKFGKCEERTGGDVCLCKCRSLRD